MPPTTKAAYGSDTDKLVSVTPVNNANNIHNTNTNNGIGANKHWFRSKPQRPEETSRGAAT